MQNKKLDDFNDTGIVINGKKMSVKEFYRRHKKRKRGVRMGMRQKEKPSPVR